MALVNKSDQRPRAGTDAADCRWAAVGAVLSGEVAVAFDHREIVEVALGRLRSKLPWQPVGMELLPQDFSLTGLQRIYELILDRRLDKRNFRKKALSFGVLEPTRRLTVGSFRPVQLYRFNRAKYRELATRGIDFEI
jgi:8-oxo-dGTP diphosphatase